MSEIIGHDINGRPLRVGDEVVMVNAVNPRSIVKNGAVLTVMRDAGTIKSSATGRVFEAFNPKEIPGFYAEYAAVRKLEDDHRPSNESFGEMMEGLVGNKRVGV